MFWLRNKKINFFVHYTLLTKGLMHGKNANPENRFSLDKASPYENITEIIKNFCQEILQ